MGVTAQGLFVTVTSVVILVAGFDLGIAAIMRAVRESGASDAD